jgi:ATP-binding cassette subfamily B (MDR/TAP) protein 1
MAKQGYYSALVIKQDGTGSGMESKASSSSDLQKLAEGEASSEAPVTAVSQQPLSLYSHVSFKNVTFSYPTRPKKLVFDGFNLDIERGATVALVGPSGGGKSTTVGLIERFYDPLSGTVEYEGTNIKTLNLQWYRDQIGYVGQEPTLCKFNWLVMFFPNSLSNVSSLMQSMIQ